MTREVADKIGAVGAAGDAAGAVTTVSSSLDRPGGEALRHAAVD